METFDLVLTIGCIIVGVIMFLGKGDALLADKNSPDRYKEYNMKKAQKGFGVAFLIIGAASGISLKVQSQMGYVIYMIVAVIALSGSVIYMKKCCKK